MAVIKLDKERKKHLIECIKNGYMNRLTLLEWQNQLPNNFSESDILNAMVDITESDKESDLCKELIKNKKCPYKELTK